LIFSIWLGGVSSESCRGAWRSGVIMHARAVCIASAWPIERAVWRRLRSVYIHKIDAACVIRYLCLNGNGC